jgi:hypothetical protein
MAVGWYPVDFARSRHTNPARIPVSPSGCWYNTLFERVIHAFGDAPAAITR